MNNFNDTQEEEKTVSTSLEVKGEERIIALLEEINAKIPELEEYEEEEMEEMEEEEEGEPEEPKEKHSKAFWTILWPSIFLLIILVRMLFLLLD